MFHRDPDWLFNIHRNPLTFLSWPCLQKEDCENSFMWPKLHCISLWMNHHFLVVSNTHTQAGGDLCPGSDVRPNTALVKCLNLRRTTRSAPHVHLLIIINLSLKFSVSLSVLSLPTTLLHTHFPSASLLDVGNYCVSSFLVHHLAPRRWQSETLVADCTNFMFTATAPQISHQPLWKPSRQQHWSGCSCLKYRYAQHLKSSRGSWNDCCRNMQYSVALKTEASDGFCIYSELQ